MTIAPAAERHTAWERERVSLLGMRVDALDRSGVEAQLDTFVRSGRPNQIVTVNMDFIHIGTRNAEFRRVVNDASLAVPDGVPVIWAARYLGRSLGDRITGPDLIEMAVRHSIDNGSSLFFLGAAPGVALNAAERLRERFGDFQLAGAHSPPFGPLEGPANERTRRMIADARPDFLFVGFGCPRQDFWIRDNFDLNVPVSAGIGGSFDLLSGALSRAPGWAQRSGLEWMFRLYHEPRRLAKRYLVDDVRVVGKLLLSRFSGPQEAAHAGDGG